MTKPAWFTLGRLVLGAGVAALALVVAVGLALRFWILPGIEDYKPRIAQAISDATGLNARLTRVRAHWDGLQPVLGFEGIEFFDNDGRSVLGFDRVEGSLSWWSVPARKPQFVALEIVKPNLMVRRDAQGRIFVAGVALADNQTGDAGFGEWLLHQPRVAVRGAQIEWLDELRGRPALKLSNADVTLENIGTQRKLKLSAQPPAEVARDLELTADLRGRNLQDLSDWTGTLYAAANGANLVTLNEYLPFSSKLKSGTGSVKTWVEIAGGRATGVSAQVDLQNVNARLSEDLLPLNLTSLAGKFGYAVKGDQHAFTTRALQGQFVSPRVRLAPTDLDLTISATPQGYGQRGTLKANHIDLGALVALAAALPLPEADRARLRAWMPSGVLSTVEAKWSGLEQAQRNYALRAQFNNVSWKAVNYVPGANGLSGSVDATQTGGTLTLASGKSALLFPKALAHTLQFDTLTGQTNWQRQGDQFLFKIENVSFANADLAGSAFGSYKTAPKAAPGPGWIDLTGKVVRGRGENLERYLPLVLGERVRTWLGHAIESGRGRDANLILKGDLYHFPFRDDKNGVFDITAQVEDVKLWYANAWPRLERAQGTLHFRGSRMEIVGEASIFGARVRNLRAVIPVLGTGAELLQVSGEGTAPLQDALKFIAQSPVNERLHRRTEALRGGGEGTLKLQLELPLHDLTHSKVAGEYHFNGNTLDDAKRGFPALSQLSGKLAFTGQSVSAQGLRAEALGAPVSFDLTSGKQGIEINASGEADLARLHAEYGHALLRGLSGRARWDGKLGLDGATTRLNVKASGDLLGAPAKFAITRADDGALRIEGKGSAQAAELAKALPDIDWKLVDKVSDWRAVVNVTDKQTQVKLDADAIVLGKPARISAEGPSESLRVAAQGQIDARRLGELYPGAWNGYLAGETNWRAELLGSASQKTSTQDNKRGSTLRIESDLRGIASTLPAPFGKSPNEAMPLVIDIAPLAADQDLLRLSLGERASAQLVRSKQADGKTALTRGSVQLGGPAPAPPNAGISVAGAVRDFDLSAWLDFQREMGAARGTAQAASAAPRINGVAITAQRLTAIGRVFDNVNMRVGVRGGAWRAVLSGTQIEGALDWLPAQAQGGSGKLTGQFERLILPTELAPQTKATGASKLPLRPSEFPALEFSVQDFQIKQRRLGRLSLNASPEGTTWRIDALTLASPAATLSATGLWSSVNETPGSGIEGEWRIDDLGEFMEAMGYPATIAGGAAQLNGRLAWQGAPFDFNTATLGGEIKLSAKEGQFLKIQPGAGKLLSLISLQALPRRITLDFRDVFSEGFVFDAVKARVNVAQGVLSTNDFEMKGTGARVKMAGTIDARSETQQMRVKVLPSLGGTVAVAGTIAGGPVAGIGAYVLQKLMKEPFDEILAYEYDISGAWADPQVKKVPRALPPERPRPR